MSARLVELAWAGTPLGEISLRRRVEPVTGSTVHEIRLDEEFLMSSMFTHAEEELARLGLAAADGEALDVLVGGLGLGCTAAAALCDPRVASLEVVDVLGEVVSWHTRGLLPLSSSLTGDSRCRLVVDDVVALLARAAPGGAVGGAGRQRYDVVLLDVDHSPRHVLHPAHARLYTERGLAGVVRRLRPGGVFALWADGSPDEEFVAVLSSVFASREAHVVSFPNPLTGGESSSTVYVATTATPGRGGSGRRCAAQGASGAGAAAGGPGGPGEPFSTEPATSGDSPSNQARTARS